MIDPKSVLYSGRHFSSQDLALMRQAVRDYSGLGITEIARTICEWLDWKRPNGKLKTMSAVYCWSGSIIKASWCCLPCADPVAAVHAQSPSIPQPTHPCRFKPRLPHWNRYASL